jgi:hypothetical protein
VDASTGIVEFRSIRIGIRPTVRASSGGIVYEKRYANWLTWTIVVFSGGLAALAWPWILFGRSSITIPRQTIQGIDIKRGTSYAVLQVQSTTDTIEFRTDAPTAESARNVLMASV